MPIETVSILAGGKRWTAFESIAVDAAINHALRSFRMTVAAEPGVAATARALKPGTAIDIMLGADLAFRGYIDRYAPSTEGHDGSEISISGRSKGQDFVDCSAMHDTGHFENQTLLQIAQALDVFGVGIFADANVELEPIEDYQVTPGEHAFAAIEKLARKQAVTLAGEPDGRIRITKAGTVRHAGGLFEGRNFSQLGSELDWSGRHSKIIVRGQGENGTGDEVLEVEATAEDGAVGRYRPLIIVEDGDLDQAAAQKRADTRRDREAGHSLKAHGTAPGFRDEAGKLWVPGNLIWTESEFLALTQVMMIEHVGWHQDRKGGSTSRLTLVDPRAFAGKSGKGSSAGGEWDIDD